MLFHAIAGSYHWWELPQLSFLPWQNFCHDNLFVATNMCLMQQNTSFVVTKICLLRQNCCHDKIMFVATNICHDKTKMILVAAPANGTLRYGDMTEASAPCNLHPPPQPSLSPTSIWLKPHRGMLAGKLWALTPSLPLPVKFPGWRMNGHACKQNIFWSYDTSTFSAVRSDKNPLICLCGKKEA